MKFHFRWVDVSIYHRDLTSSMVKSTMFSESTRLQESERHEANLVRHLLPSAGRDRNVVTLCARYMIRNQEGTMTAVLILGLGSYRLG